MGIWLVMQALDGVERSFSVHKPCTIIGRETTCDVRIPVPSVSQKHCQITLNDGRLELNDLNSDHGTFHNGCRVNQAALQAEDTLTIGPVTFRVRMRQEATADAGMDLVIERLPETSGRPEAAADFSG